MNRLFAAALMRRSLGRTGVCRVLGVSHAAASSGMSSNSSLVVASAGLPHHHSLRFSTDSATEVLMSQYKAKEPDATILEGK